MISREAKLILHSSKLNITKHDEKIISDCIGYDVDWGRFLSLGTYHRVIPLVWNTFQKLNINRYVQHNVRQTMYHEYLATKEYCCQMLKEVNVINNKFSKEGIKAALLKGAILAPMIYKDIGLRHFKDIDYLISKEDVDGVTQALQEIGYIQGYYDPVLKKIDPASKKEKIFQRMNTHELIPFVKMTDNVFCPVCIVDVNFEISWKGDKKNRNKFSMNIVEIINQSRLVDYGGSNIFCLSPEYLLIQLCLHLYSEAVYLCWNDHWVRDINDLNLIKFCDLHEYILQQTIDWDNLFRLVVENTIQEPVYYSLALLNKIFGEVAPPEFLEKLNINESVTQKFYDKNGNELFWDLGFFDRMFEIKNKVNEIIRKKIF